PRTRSPRCGTRAIRPEATGTPGTGWSGCRERTGCTPRSLSPLGASGRGSPYVKPAGRDMVPPTSHQETIRRGRRAFSLVTMLVLVAGTALVAAAPAGATTVTTEAELRTAFASDATVDLGASITLTDCAAGDGGSLLRPDTNPDPVTLDGHGFTITQTCASNAVVQNSTAGMTVRNLT